MRDDNVELAIYYLSYQMMRDVESKVIENFCDREIWKGSYQILAEYNSLISTDAADHEIEEKLKQCMTLLPKVFYI